VAELDKYLTFLKKQGGSDLHVCSKTRLQIRLHGSMTALVSLFKRVRAKEGHLLLTAMQAEVTDILESAYLLNLFQTAPDPQQVVAEMKKFI
jgi:Tfp pilus assembly pilus retraction ATPase PilT